MKPVLVLFLCLAVYTVKAVDSGKGRTEETPSSRPFGAVGGKQIDIRQRPYTAAVLKREDYFLGGGVIVDKYWVLTAGQVVNNLTASQLQVRVGCDDTMTAGAVVNATRLVVHPKFTGDWQYNLALIKLEYHIVAGDMTQTIGLGESLPKAGELTVLSGYGGLYFAQITDAYLREVTVPFIPYDKCKNNYKSHPDFTSASFCASAKNVGPCPLDWGSPLVYKKKLIGIYSGNYEKCGSTKFPAAYVDVTQFSQWIKETIKQ